MAKFVCTYTWYIIIGTDAILQQPVPNFPCENAGTFAFIIGYFVDDFL